MPNDIETKKQPEKSKARPGQGNEVLRAQPVEGEIDHAALSREFIARFPKLRAALAK